MKSIRIISLILALLMLSLAVVSCGGNEDKNTTENGSKESATPKPTNKKPTPKPTVKEGLKYEFDFNGITGVDDLEAEGLSFVKSNDVKFEDAIKIGYSSTNGNSGMFNIRDEELLLNEEVGEYSYLTMTMKWTVDQLPKGDNQLSVITAVYEGGPYTSYDAAGKPTDHEDGMHYQFFFKLDNEGKLYYYDPQRWAQPVKDVTIEEGKTYELKCEMALTAEDSYAYTIYLDGKRVHSYYFDYSFKDGETKDFYLRFCEPKDNYKMTFDDLVIELEPVF